MGTGVRICVFKAWKSFFGSAFNTTQEMNPEWKEQQ